MATQIEWTEHDPESDAPRRAQIVRAVGPLQMEHLIGYDIEVHHDPTAPLGERFVLRLEVEVPITRAQAVAITTPNDLQAVRATDALTWPSSLVYEYARQWEAKHRLPNPPLTIHPDEIRRIWESQNGPLPAERN